MIVKGLACAALALAAFAPLPGAAQFTPPEIRFPVDTFVVEGENPLSASETERVLGPYRGGNVTLERLQEAVTALERELHARGHLFLRVALQPQLVQGTVRLNVLAFKLDEIRVTGNQHFSRENVLRSLPALKLGASPNLKYVARNQAHVNDHSAKNLVTTIHKSDKADSLYADVRVQDTPPQQFFVTLNNTGTSRTGHWRAGVGYSHTNLFDLDHSVTATYTTSPTHTNDIKQYGLFYRAPFYGIGGTATVYYTHSDANSGLVANFFQVSGRGEFIGARWTQRLLPIGLYNHTVDVGIEDRSFKNDISFNNTPIGVDVRSRPLLVRYEGRLGGADYEVRHLIEFAHNLSGGSSNNDFAYLSNRFGATRDWNAIRYALEGSQLFGGGWIAAAKVRGQLSDDALIPGEQFAIGGSAWVRGLEEREGTGDKGYVATLELQTPPIYEGLRALAFADTGQARLNRAAGSGLEATQSATSIGLGARWVWRRQLSVSVDWAYVLNGTASTNEHDNRVHASALYRF